MKAEWHDEQDCRHRLGCAILESIHDHLYYVLNVHLIRVSLYVLCLICMYYVLYACIVCVNMM